MSLHYIDNTAIYITRFQACKDQGMNPELVDCKKKWNPEGKYFFKNSNFSKFMPNLRDF